MFDVSLTGAFLAGLLSFVSPCVLPMVPFYLSYLAGVSVNTMATDGAVPVAVRGRAVIGSVFFAAGMLTVFVGLGASASVLGQLVRDWFDVLRWIAAALIIVMGLHFLGVFRIGLLNRQWRSEAGDTRNLGLGGAYLIGLAFAFGWTPCVGPILAAILFTAAGTDTAGQGAFLLTAYGVGMTLPFVLAAAFVGPFMKFMARFRRHLGAVERVTGVALIVFGVLIATNAMNYIGQWMLQNFEVFQTIG
ncbi:cytochrome c biogenesis protein CcdA [Roseibacterium sp. SDUM158017]|uniref:cytochrome c biogenesis CcdA family protein n=1 Tax=Roseicyclus salinarum TaxID=3036773 RepID=UPI0024154B7A|nr:cytochrome c biogenesis protein CcdA [Roseibacterium sp. SDUM158017]MDG4649385.1 cytochrome c biogenesis protein CcdA [Roseibacterium sp. SDUM158017]